MEWTFFKEKLPPTRKKIWIKESESSEDSYCVEMTVFAGDDGKIGLVAIDSNGERIPIFLNWVWCLPKNIFRGSDRHVSDFAHVIIADMDLRYIEEEDEHKIYEGIVKGFAKVLRRIEEKIIEKSFNK